MDCNFNNEIALNMQSLPVHDISLYENFCPTKENYPLRLSISNCTLWAKPYWHEQLEIIYIKDGDGILTLNGTEYNVAPGDIYIVNCNDLHYFEKSTFTLHFSITIDASFFDKVEFGHFRFTPHIKGDKYFCDIFETIFHEYDKSNDGWDMTILGNVYFLITHLLRNYKQSTLTQKTLNARKSKLKRLQSILDYISANYTEKISTSDLAELFHINKYYLCKIFKEETGQSLIDYINTYRIKCTLPLLTNTNESIERIAERAGFSDSNYYSRIFKRCMNMSPGKYRTLQ